jgi:mono/diheme cytochrome c family protein
MRVLIVLLMFASLLAAQAPAPPAAGQATAAPAGNAENGKKLFMNRACFQCHNTEAYGDGSTTGRGTDRRGPRLAPRPIAYQLFYKLVRHPADQMPPYTEKVMTDQEIADIYAFLLTIPPPPPVSSIPILNR